MTRVKEGGVFYFDCVQCRDKLNAEEKCASTKLKVHGIRVSEEVLQVRVTLKSFTQDSELRT